MVNKKISKNKKNRLFQNKKLLILALAIVFVIIAVVFTILRSGEKNNVESFTTLPEPAESINLDPPTQEELQQAIDKKQEIDENENRIENQPVNLDKDGKKVVKPVVTYSGQYGDKIEIGSYIPEIFEDNGICTAVLTSNSINVTKRNSSVKEGRSTFCPLFEIPTSDFTEKGTWSLIVKYQSATSIGESQEAKVEIR